MDDVTIMPLGAEEVNQEEKHSGGALPPVGIDIYFKENYEKSLKYVEAQYPHETAKREVYVENKLKSDHQKLIKEHETRVKDVARMIQLPLDLFPDEVRPVSNDIVQSALFSCVQGQNRKIFKRNTPLASLGHIEIGFKGEQLNQDDLNVFMQLLSYARNKPLGSLITVSANSFVKILGRCKDDASGDDIKRLNDDLERLATSLIRLTDTKKKSYIYGTILTIGGRDTETPHLIFALNPYLRLFFEANDFTQINWESRLRLQGKDLARWLQMQFLPHANPYPMKVETLWKRSGSASKELKGFRRCLKFALDELKNNGDLVSWSINPKTDILTVERGNLTDSQKRFIARNKRDISNSSVEGTGIREFLEKELTTLEKATNLNRLALCAEIELWKNASIANGQRIRYPVAAFKKWFATKTGGQ